MQQTSKGEKHLPYLHVGTLSVHNSVSENYKNSKKILAHGCLDILDNRATVVSYAHVLGLKERSQVITFGTQVP